MIREGNFILGRVLTNEYSLKTFTESQYGLGNFFKKKITERFEIYENAYFKNNEKKFQLFTNMLNDLTTFSSSLKVYSSSNIFL